MPEFSPPVELEPLGIEEADLLGRYEQIYTAVVCDTLILDYGISPVLPTNLTPLIDGMKVCGIAFTVKGMPDCRVPTPEAAAGAHDRRASMMEEMYPNNVVVWDSSRDEDNAQFGEMMTAVSMTRGSRGAVIDGGIRDTDRIAETGYKVWSRYRTPASMYLRHEIVDWQVNVKVGEVVIQPGDVVFADMDGIVVIPRRLAVPVLEKSEESQKTERGWREIIASGVAPSEFIEKGGML